MTKNEWNYFHDTIKENLEINNPYIIHSDYILENFELKKNFYNDIISSAQKYNCEFNIEFPDKISAMNGQQCGIIFSL